MEKKVNYKNILLIGPARGGKTSTARLLQEKYGYNSIMFDAIVEAIAKTPEFSQLGIKHGNLDTPLSKDFIKNLIESSFKYALPGKRHSVLDIEVLSPEYVNSFIDRNETVVIYLGYPNITPEEKLSQIRLYDTPFDWTITVEDNELLRTLQEHIQTSKELQKEAEKYGFIFIDTSFDRENVIKKKIEELENGNILIRDEKSYEKNYRRKIGEER